jgi:hypothetical protein
MVPRGGVPVVSITNGLDWQTAARGNFDPQRFSGALANLFLTYFEPQPQMTNEQLEAKRTEQRALGTSKQCAE